MVRVQTLEDVHKGFSPNVWSFVYHVVVCLPNYTYETRRPIKKDTEDGDKVSKGDVVFDMDFSFLWDLEKVISFYVEDLGWRSNMGVVHTGDPVSVVSIGFYNMDPHVTSSEKG